MSSVADSARLSPDAVENAVAIVQLYYSSASARSKRVLVPAAPGDASRARYERMIGRAKPRAHESYDARMRRLAACRESCPTCNAGTGERCRRMMWQPDPVDPGFELLLPSKHYTRGFHANRKKLPPPKPAREQRLPAGHQRVVPTQEQLAMAITRSDTFVSNRARNRAKLDLAMLRRGEDPWAE